MLSLSRPHPRPPPPPRARPRRPRPRRRRRLRWRCGEVTSPAAGSTTPAPSRPRPRPCSRHRSTRVSPTSCCWSGRRRQRRRRRRRRRRAGPHPAAGRDPGRGSGRVVLVARQPTAAQEHRRRHGARARPGGRRRRRGARPGRRRSPTAGRRATTGRSSVTAGGAAVVNDAVSTGSSPTCSGPRRSPCRSRSSCWSWCSAAWWRRCCRWRSASSPSSARSSCCRCSRIVHRRLDLLAQPHDRPRPRAWPSTTACSSSPASARSWPAATTPRDAVVRTVRTAGRTVVVQRRHRRHLAGGPARVPDHVPAVVRLRRHRGGADGRASARSSCCRRCSPCSARGSNKWAVFHRTAAPAVGEGVWHRIATTVMRRPVPIATGGHRRSCSFLGAPFLAHRLRPARRPGAARPATPCARSAGRPARRLHVPGGRRARGRR